MRAIRSFVVEGFSLIDLLLPCWYMNWLPLAVADRTDLAGCPLLTMQSCWD